MSPAPSAASPRAAVPAYPPGSERSLGDDLAIDEPLDIEQPEPAPPPAEGAPPAGFDPLVYDDEELDEDEIEADEAPGFSLLEELVRSGQPRTGGPPALEVITSERGDVRRTDLLERKGPSRLRPRTSPVLRQARLLEPKLAEVWFTHDASGVLIDEGRKVPLDNLKTPTNAVSKKADAYKVALRPGQSLTLRSVSGEQGCHLRFVEPPVLPPPPRAQRGLDGPIPRAIGSSVLVHLMVAVVVGLAAPSVSFSEAQREVWAEVDLEEVRPVEVPPPEPEPEVVPEPVPEPEPEPQPKPKKQRVRPPPSPKPQKTKAAPKGKPAREVKTAGVLGALGKLNQAAPGKKSMVAAVSNLDTVKAPGSSSYRVGALIGKAPTSEVRLGGGGGGEPLTRGSANLLRGGSGFARIGKSSGAKVRGKVNRAVANRVVAKGSISREEVARVINEHMHEVQSCYERALIGNPGLRGKLTVEWTIRTNGQVANVKQKFSTLQGAEVARCVMNKLKRWRFPPPRGGVVVVSNPFNFASTSY